MNKIVRGILYGSSLILLILVFGLGYQKIHEQRENRQQDTQPVTEQAAVAGEEETEQAASNTEAGQTAQVTDVTAESTTEPGVPETGSEMQDTEAAATTLVFTGDILIGNSVSANYSARGIDGILSEEMQSLLSDADITMVNEEFPFGTGGTAMEDKQYTFRVNPSYVAAFLDMGVDIVSLANNHILDYGPEALEETFAVLDTAGIRYAGAGGSKARAMEPQIIEVNGKKFGFLAASRVIPVASWNVENQTPGVFATYDATALDAAIAETKKECDYLTVFVHWGLEHREYPEDYEHTLAAGYVDAGADLVIGSHSHCLQGVEYINGKPVFYSLGNFLFGQDGNTAAVKVTVAPDGTAQYAFVAAREKGACTMKLSGEEERQLYTYLDSISFHASVDGNGVLSEK